MDVCFAICISLLLYQNIQLKDNLEDQVKEVNIELGFVYEEIECNQRLIFALETNGCTDEFEAKFKDEW